MTPASTSDVALIIETLGAAYEIGLQVFFTIRGRGHSPVVGASNIDQRISVDLSPMRTIRLNGDESITSDESKML